METNGYRAVYKGGQGEIIEKKSRFIATVLPIETEEEALEFIAKMKKKYWDARHNCYAYAIGERQELQRCSDDGEPNGTAGRPMLDVLLHEDIHNTVLAQNNIPIADSIYGENVSIQVVVPAQQQEKLEKELIEGTNGKAEIDWEKEVVFAIVEKDLKIF